MTNSTVAEAPYDGARMARTLAAFRATSGLDVVFGGAVRREGGDFEITATCGALGSWLDGLRIVGGRGIGGKTLQTMQPGWVDHYYSARGITHHYDVPTRREQLETVAAVPIVVNRVPRMIVYLASRTQVSLGTAWIDGLRPLVRSVERQILVEDEVQARVARLLPPPGLSDASAPAGSREADHRWDLVAELSELATLVDDVVVRDRLNRLLERLGGGPTLKQSVTLLAPREIDVLRQVALGRSNRAAAEALGIVESTAKSYLKSATRKLNADNRVHAVHLARETGLI
jgi:DNA-binding CsgD family transcriptional regulator